LTPTATITATETMPPVLPYLHIGRVDPQVRPVALDRAIEEGGHALVDFLAKPAHLALGDAVHPQRLDQIIDRACRDALDIGFLDHRRQRLLGHATRLQKARKIAALAQAGDAQLDGPGPGLPIALAVPVALNQAVRRLLAITRAGQATDLHLHQPLGGKRDHVAQNIRVRGLLDQRAQVHHGIGHRGSFRQVRVLQPKPIRKSR
jgi:hypothetical protein